MKELYLDDELFRGTEEEFLAIKEFYCKKWKLNGGYYRVVYWNEREEWFKDDMHHRIDGPALIWKSGRKFWIFEDLEYNDFFNKFFPMENFIKDKFPGE